MTQPLEHQNLSSRFQHLLALMKSERFLQMQGLGNEVPFFICPYKVEESVDMNRSIQQLKRSLEQLDIGIVEVNLYDLCIEILQQDDDLTWYIENETDNTKSMLLDDLQSMLDVTNNIIPKISEKIQEQQCDILFITGVGEVFPFIRSHNVLNNLQSTAKSHPTVLFFPGKYTHSLEHGGSLDLFGRLHDDKYYRAFNIYNCEVTL